MLWSLEKDKKLSMIIFIDLSKPSFVSVFIFKYSLFILEILCRLFSLLIVFETNISAFFRVLFLILFQSFSVNVFSTPRIKRTAKLGPFFKNQSKSKPAFLIVNQKRPFLTKMGEWPIGTLTSWSYRRSSLRRTSWLSLWPYSTRKRPRWWYLLPRWSIRR